MNSINPESVSIIESGFHENGYFGDNRLRNRDFVTQYAEKRGFNVEEALEAAKNIVRESDEEIAQLDARQAELVKETIASTGDKKVRKGMVVAVKLGDDEAPNLVRLDSVRGGQIYGPTVNVNTYGNQTYLDGDWTIDCIVRPGT